MQDKAAASLPHHTDGSLLLQREGGSQCKDPKGMTSFTFSIQGSTVALFRYPEHPDFPTEYQIRRNSNPVGLPIFASILVPDFRPSTIVLTDMFKQIKQTRVTLMERRGTRGVTRVIVALFIEHSVRGFLTCMV